MTWPGQSAPGRRVPHSSGEHPAPRRRPRPVVVEGCPFDVHVHALLSVPGLLKDVKKQSSLIPHATLEELGAFEAKGIISGGMRPKVAAVKAALQSGVSSAHLVSGLAPDALLAEIFTNEGSGTMIVGAVAG